MRKLAVLVMLIGLTLTLGEGEGRVAGDANTLDIAAELSRPGVKLLAVDFYAQWCKPCMAAMPKWEKILKKYKKRGLRFVAVSAEDNACDDPGWSPDLKLCDADHAIRDRLKLKDTLPTYLLYSWEGGIYLITHDVNVMEKAIESYFRDVNLAIVVNQPDVRGDAMRENPAWVRERVVAELSGQTKFDIVASSAGRLPWETSNETCEDRFPPNSVLHIKLEGGMVSRRSVTLAIEKDGCIKGQVQKNYEGGAQERPSLERAVSEGVAELLAKVVKVRPPHQEGDAAGQRRDNADDDWFGSSQEEAVVEFRPQPEGALVEVEGKLVCDKACSKRLAVGKHYSVTVKAVDYVPQTKTVTVKKGLVIDWKLQADFGWLNVTTQPAGLSVRIDREEAGASPVLRRKASPGRREVRVESACHESASEVATVAREKETSVTLTPKPREGGIDVSVQDRDGNDVAAEVYVDGVRVGEAPGRFKASVCAKEVEVRSGRHGGAKKSVAVQEKKLTAVAFVLEKERRDAYGVEWVSIPAGVYTMGCSPGDSRCDLDENPPQRVTIRAFGMMKTEVTQGVYEKVMGTNPSYFKNCGADCPVEQVNWSEAKAFCEKVGGRLPTEAEWEYAARAGTATELYTGRLTVKGLHNGPELDPIAWYGGNSGVSYGGGSDCSGWSEKQYSSSTCGTHPAGKKRPNAWGLYDMLGNVWEWVEDCYSDKLGGANNCSHRVLRGGSWDFFARGVRASLRVRLDPTLRYLNIGFRCARDGN